jgi:reverse gyrase
VAVRIDAGGRVRALNDIPVPRRYADIFIEIPEHRFRLDTSSSEIRARRRADRDVQLVIHSKPPG